MTCQQASQIANLLNTQNKLVIRYEAARILEEAETYIFETSEGAEVIGCIQLKRVQWYQYEVDHLAVAPNSRRSGLAGRLLKKAEEQARKAGGRLLQCTIREDNNASQALFSKYDFSHVGDFHYPMSGNNVGIWQKIISPPRSKEDS